MDDCNDETNTAEDNYDGGDCCLSNDNTDHCTEWAFVIFKNTCATGNHQSLVGDGYCNDETNNIPDCNYYDGGDCCGSCINTDFPDICSCIGYITGNGVPQNS